MDQKPRPHSNFPDQGGSASHHRREPPGLCPPPENGGRANSLKSLIPTTTLKRRKHMALTWNLKNCTDIDVLLADAPTGWPVTDSTIWLTMIVGMNSITEQNAPKFYHRVHWFQVAAGPVIKGLVIMPPHITARIGMTTNASQLTDAEWRKKLDGIMAETSHQEWEHWSQVETVEAF
jgi:hypothetical protein